MTDEPAAGGAARRRARVFAIAAGVALANLFDAQPAGGRTHSAHNRPTGRTHGDAGSASAA